MLPNKRMQLMGASILSWPVVAANARSVRLRDLHQEVETEDATRASVFPYYAGGGLAPGSPRASISN